MKIVTDIQRCAYEKWGLHLRSQSIVACAILLGVLIPVFLVQLSIREEVDTKIVDEAIVDQEVEKSIEDLEKNLR